MLVKGFSGGLKILSMLFLIVKSYFFDNQQYDNQQYEYDMDKILSL